jgi:uncharacterized protein YjiS (DUF1127 family)
MSIANDSSIYSSAPGTIRRAIRYAGIRTGRLINHWIAALIARREYQAQLTVLRSLSDRQLSDMGLARGQIGEGLADAGRERSRTRDSRHGS